MEDLVDDARREHVDLGALLVGQVAELAAETLELSPADLLHRVSQRGDRGHDLEAAQPVVHAAQLLHDDALGVVRLFLALAAVLLHHVLQVVDVVEVGVAHAVDLGVEVARHGDVDEEDGPVTPVLERTLDTLTRDDVVRRRGGADDDVGGGQVPFEVLEGHGAAADPVGQLLRGAERAVGDEDVLDAVRLEVRGGELAGLAGAHDEHGVVLELAEHLEGQLDGRGAHAHRALADGRLGAHALADFERVPEQAVEDDAGATALAGLLVGGLHLGDDLRLADDHRVEARGDAEQVGDGRVPRVAVEARLELADGHSGVLRQALDGSLARRQRVATVEVQLGAVAGAQSEGFAGGPAVQQLLGHAQRAALVEGETLAQFERGGLVRDAGDDDEHSVSLRRCGSRSGTVRRRSG